MYNAYEKIIDRIARTSGLTAEDVMRKVEAKQQKISGLISKEGAAQIIAAELGISLENEKSKISEIIPGMKKVNVIGKVINIFPTRSFTKNGQESKVSNMVIADETSNIKVVLWDSNHIELIEKGNISQGNVVEIMNASSRGNEIHLGSFSEIKLSSEPMNKVRTEKIFNEKKISELNISDNAGVRGFVVQVFEPKFFNVCSECKKKAISEGDGFSCVTHGKVVPEKRCLVNFVLDDGTATIRAVLFHDVVSRMNLLNGEEFPEVRKKDILGKEMLFSGNVRMNKFFNEPEIIIESAEEVDLDKLIIKLEGRS